MRPDLTSILAGIAAGDAEALLGAGELLRAHRIGLVNTAVIEPYSSMYASEPLEQSDVEALRKGLISYLEAGQATNASSAVHALGELRDPALVPFLREQLASRLQELMVQKSVVGQLVVGLNDLGEDLFKGSYSVTNIDENVASAMRYLREHGVVVPW